MMQKKSYSIFLSIFYYTSNNRYCYAICNMLFCPLLDNWILSSSKLGVVKQEMWSDSISWFGKCSISYT